MANEKKSFSAILFDMGGVLIRYQNEELLLKIFQTVLKNPKFGQAIKRYEIGTSSLPEMEGIVEEVMGEGQFELVQKTLMKDISMSSVDPVVWTAVDRLRSMGFRLGLLTNNGFLDKGRTRSAIIDDTSMFDIIVESCRIGTRKPESRFFQEALKVGDLRADECVFIDDIEGNCLGAEAVGITAIHVRSFDSRAAIAELEELLHLQGQLMDETLPSN